MVARISNYQMYTNTKKSNLYIQLLSVLPKFEMTNESLVYNDNGNSFWHICVYTILRMIHGTAISPYTQINTWKVLCVLCNHCKHWTDGNDTPPKLCQLMGLVFRALVCILDSDMITGTTNIVLSDDNDKAL